jgi:(p)ppGpp synthase/HD superfamily hydrolase
VLERARALAAKLHEGRPYNDYHPYTYHLDAVEEVLRRFGCSDESLLVAAQLHDSIEDIVVFPKSVRTRFWTSRSNAGVCGDK